MENTIVDGGGLVVPRPARLVVEGDGWLAIETDFPVDDDGAGGSRVTFRRSLVI